MTDKGTPAPDQPVDAETVRKLLQHVPLSVNQTVIVTRGPQVIAHRGALRQTDAADVAVYVAEGWRDVGQTMRLQFMDKPPAPARILLTYPLRDGHRLIVVDIADASLPQLRNLSTQLLEILDVAGLGGSRPG